MSKNIREIAQPDFESTVLESKYAIVDFFSTECPPCDALASKFEALAELFSDKITFVKIFRQGNRDLAEKLGVRGSPTLLFFKDGKQLDTKLTGGILRSEILKEIRNFLGDEEVDKTLASIETVQTQTDVLILGGGPAGLTAAIYAAQAKRKTILVDPALPGGQVSTTHQVSNYPGFIEPQPGFMLSHYMSEQARGAGAEYRVAVEIENIDLDKKEIIIDGVEKITAKKIILAMGSQPRLLELPGEKEYKGQGISYCATCDGKYYEDKEIIVIGGGNSAIEEALFLTRFASKVQIVHQFDELQANKEAQEKAFANEKMEFLFHHEPRQFIKTERGMDVVVEDLENSESRTLSTDGVFIFVGMKPNLSESLGSLKLDDWGYLDVDKTMHTSVPNVFAAGDVASKPFRQITVAVAEGTVAAIQACKELGEEE